jgi:prophage regulatory protein
MFHLREKDMLDKILRRPAVEYITGLGRSAIYDAMKKGTFPQAVKLGPKAVGWRESDIRKWLENLSQPAEGGRHEG